MALILKLLMRLLTVVNLDLSLALVYLVWSCVSSGVVELRLNRRVRTSRLTRLSILGGATCLVGVPGIGRIGAGRELTLARTVLSTLRVPRRDRGLGTTLDPRLALTRLSSVRSAIVLTPFAMFPRMR